MNKSFRFNNTKKYCCKKLIFSARTLAIWIILFLNIIYESRATILCKNLDVEHASFILKTWLNFWTIRNFKRVCSLKSLFDFYGRPLKRFLSMRATILQSAFFVIQSKTYNFLRKTVKKACFLGKFLSFWLIYKKADCRIVALIERNRLRGRS